MAKQLELCVPCMEKLKEAYEMKKVKGGVNMKVLCSCCQKRRFGALYEAVLIKGGTHNEQ